MSLADPQSPDRRRWFIVAIAMMLAGQAIVMTLTAARLTVTHDEYWHIPVGLLNWKTGRFDVEPLNPPLLRMCATWPLLFTSAESPLTEPTSDLTRKNPSRIRLKGSNTALFRIGECTEHVTIRDIELFADSNVGTSGIEAFGAWVSSQGFNFDRVTFQGFDRGINAYALPQTNLNWCAWLPRRQPMMTAPSPFGFRAAKGSALKCPPIRNRWKLAKAG